MYGRSHATVALIHILTFIAPFIAPFTVDTTSFLSLREIHKDYLCDILQEMAPTHVETVHQFFLFQFESYLDWQLLFRSLSSVITRRFLSPNSQ